MNDGYSSRMMNHSGNKLIVLDRDGVINVESVDFIKSPEEWIPIPGSLEAIVKLKQAGYLITVATNQSGVARGLFDLNMLNRIHEKMLGMVREIGGDIDGIFLCPHGPNDNCECRKPKPGLFKQIEARFNCSLQQDKTPCIGDSLRDLEAAFAIGAKPILVLTGNGQETAKKLPDHLKDIPQFLDLTSVVQKLVAPVL